MSGLLLAFEGLDGAGKSTQVELLRRWLDETGVPCLVTEWNSSKLVHGALRDAKRAHRLTPRTYSLFHALDFADRYERQILPALAVSPGVVICDRYIYTAFARDAARGLYSRWVQSLYSFARKPDLTFYLTVPIEMALQRIQESRGHRSKDAGASLKFYEAGLDMKLSSDPARSFRIFQRRVSGEYERLTPLLDFTVIDGGDKPHAQHLAIREAVAAALGESAGLK